MGTQQARADAATGTTPARTRTHARPCTTPARASAGCRADATNTRADDRFTSDAIHAGGADPIPRPVRHARARARSSDLDTGGTQPTTHRLIDSTAEWHNCLCHSK